MEERLRKVAIRVLSISSERISPTVVLSIRGMGIVPSFQL